MPFQASTMVPPRWSPPPLELPASDDDDEPPPQPASAPTSTARQAPRTMLRRTPTFIELLLDRRHRGRTAWPVDHTARRRQQSGALLESRVIARRTPRPSSSSSATRLPEPFATPVDDALLRRMVAAISSVGSHPLGFRAAGTPEERQVAELVAAEMRSIGLADVGFEQVPVDGWRFRDASLRVAGGRRYACSSMAGSPATPKAGISGRLVFVGDGRRDRLDRLDLRGTIALVDWRTASIGIGEIGLELGRRGAVAVVMTSGDGGARFQGPDALGTSVAGWYAQAPPLAVLRKQDAVGLIERCQRKPPTVTVKVDIEVNPRARGRNVVGVLGRELPGAPIVVGAHHDGMVLRRIRQRQRRGGGADHRQGADRIGLAAEPPGLVRVAHRRGVRAHGRAPVLAHGAWQQAAEQHPRWGTTVPFYLDIEASGRPDFPLLVLGPVELRRFAARYCAMAKRAGMLPARGWRFANPSTGTHQWPFQLAGVPGLSVFNWHTEFQRTDYHTDLDTIDRLDFSHLANLCRLDAALLVAADAAGDELLDYPARARDVERAGAGLPGRRGLVSAARRYGKRGSRASFARLARTSFAVGAGAEPGYLWAQAAADAAQLELALRALKAGDRRAAVRAASRVGMNGMARWVSHDVQRMAERRWASPHGSWPAKSHLTRSPDLWAELASLRGERDARPFGPWVARSLEKHRARMRAEVTRRTGRVAAALRG